MDFLRSFGRLSLLLSSFRTTASNNSCSVFSTQLTELIPYRIQRRRADHSFCWPRGLSRCQASVCYDGLFQGSTCISKPPGQLRQNHSSAQTLPKDWQLELQRLRNIKSPTSRQLLQFTEAVSPFLREISRLKANDPGLRSYAPFVARTLQLVAKHMSKNAVLRENLKIYWQYSGNFLAWWYEAAGKTMDYFSPIELSTFVLYSHVHLDIAPPERFLRPWEKVAMPAMDKFDAQSLSNILFAHGRFKIMPSEILLPFWYDNAAKSLADFNTQELANSMHAHGRLKLRPREDFLNQWYDCATSWLVDFTTQQLANSMYAHGELKLKPRADFLERWYEAAVIKIHQFKTQDLANSLYAFSQFGLKPRKDFLNVWYPRAMLVLHEATEQALANIIYAHSLLKLTPPLTFSKRWQDVATSCLPVFTVQGLSNSIYAIALLELKPADTFLKSFAATVLALVHTLNAKHLCTCIYALAKLNAKPTREFIERWCCRTTELSVPKLNGTEIFHCLFGLSQLNVAVPSVLLKQLCATVADRFEEDDNETLWLRMCLKIAHNYRGDHIKLRKNCVGALYWQLLYHFRVDCSKWSEAEKILEEALESGLTVTDLFTSRLV